MTLNDIIKISLKLALSRIIVSHVLEGIQNYIYEYTFDLKGSTATTKLIFFLKKKLFISLSLFSKFITSKHL